MPIECICQICQKPFFTIPSRIAAGKDICCSKACADAYKRRRQIVCLCENPACGKTLYIAQSLLSRGKKYCSMCCRSEANTMLRTCQNLACGKTFIAYQSEIRKGGGKYCSWTCRPKAQPSISQSYERQRQPVTERFWNNVQRCSHGESCPFCCWPWVGRRKDSKWDYGLFSMLAEGKSMTYRTHRLAWEWLNQRSIPTHLWILHHCDVPACVNPWHCYPGTPKDNTQDAVMRDRFPHGHTGKIARGSDFARSKLTENKVVIIRQRHTQGEKQNALAKEFGVSCATICLVINRTIWAHVL